MTFTQKDILEKIKKILNDNATDTTAFLYGSRARGDARYNSDWDILVLLDKSEDELSDFKRIAYPLYDLGLEINADISVNLYTKEDWGKRSFTPFYKNVQNEGIKL